MNLTLTFNLIGHRCSECGTFYWIEEDRNRSFPVCPRCTQDRIDAHITQEETLRRSITSLKGVITRLKWQLRKRP